MTWLVPIGALLTFGLAAPVLFAIAGIQTRQRSWQRAAGFYAVAIWGGVVLLGASEGDSAPGIIGFLAWLIGWISATVHAFLIRGEYQHRLAGAQNPLEAARSAVEARKEAHRLVRDEPDVARERGVGRPDVEGARTVGVIDVSQVPATVLATLPRHRQPPRRRDRARPRGDRRLRPYVVFVPR